MGKIGAKKGKVGTNMSEEWRDVEGYEGIYQVSNLGRVRSLDRKIHNYIKPGKILTPRNNGHSYFEVSLHRVGHKDKHVYIHRIVAAAFIPNPDNLPEVNHIDFDKSNNAVSNLEWVSSKENKAHFRKSHRANIAEEHRKQKLTSKVLQRVKDNKDEIINLYRKGATINEISKTLSLGRDFVSDVLDLFDETYKRG